MKSFIKKAAAFCSALVCISALPNIYAKESYAAATQNVLLGDVNGNGIVNIADAVLIKQYILGLYTADSYQLTCMDFNQDFIIDDTDALMVQNVAVELISAYTVNKTLYNVPNYEARTYYRHDCNSTNASSKTAYTLSDSSRNADYSISTYDERPEENRDHENTNVVQLSCGGSGFIVGKNVIATAAHCVYGDGKFIDDLTINIYNSQGEVNNSNLVQSCKARYIHIPQKYVTLNRDANYDYALIYVDEDLSKYGIWSMGVPVDNFMETGKFITASGFTTHSDTYARYYDEGAVRSFYECDEADKNLEYRISAESRAYPGKSGGILYYKSSYDGKLTSSAVGVITGRRGDNDYVWGVRMTPTLLHFYKQNNHLT